MSAPQRDQVADASPGSKESGLRLSNTQIHPLNRTPKAFFSRLLSPVEIDRIIRLLQGPQRPVALDRRLLRLGLARIILGKTVATSAARYAVWRERYEVRRGSDVRCLALVGVIEADTPREALAEAWALARRDVGPRWQARLVQAGDEGRWSIFLPPPRVWPAWSARPYLLELSNTQSKGSLP